MNVLEWLKIEVKKKLMSSLIAGRELQDRRKAEFRVENAIVIIKKLFCADEKMPLI